MNALREAVAVVVMVAAEAVATAAAAVDMAAAAVDMAAAAVEVAGVDTAAVVAVAMAATAVAVVTAVIGAAGINRFASRNNKNSFDQGPKKIDGPRFEFCSQFCQATKCRFTS